MAGVMPASPAPRTSTRIPFPDPSSGGGCRCFEAGNRPQADSAPATAWLPPVTPSSAKNRRRLSVTGDVAEEVDLAGFERDLGRDLLASRCQQPELGVLEHERVGSGAVVAKRHLDAARGQAPRVFLPGDVDRDEESTIGGSVLVSDIGIVVAARWDAHQETDEHERAGESPGLSVEHGRPPSDRIAVFAFGGPGRASRKGHGASGNESGTFDARLS